MSDDSNALAVGLGAGLGGFAGLVGLCERIDRFTLAFRFLLAAFYGKSAVARECSRARRKPLTTKTLLVLAGATRRNLRR